MAQSNIVFLIDVNAILRESSNAKEKEASEPVANLQNESTELFPFKEDDDVSKSSEILGWLREFVLVTLFKEANNGKDYDFSKVQWSFKFFDSSHHVDYRDGRTFQPFDIESFNNFETQLNQRMKVGSEGANTDLYSQYDCSRVKYLSDAIKAITSLSWSDSSQLELSKSFNGDEAITKNSVYTFFRVPRNEKQFKEFSDLHSNSSTKDFMSVLLPAAFSHIFHHKLRIQLNFVDMWGAPENANHCFLPDWNGTYPRQIVKCLQYLGNGKVVKVPTSEYGALSSTCMSLGLIDYIIYLRSRLQQASTQNENVPTHIQKLAPVAGKSGLKISPEFDTDSLSRSFKSASVLETSMNSQNNKVLRPFRMSSGYYEDEPPDFFPHKLSHIERLKEGERKRKRYEYDSSEDFYSRHERERRRYSGMDDGDTDSVDIDSQCERDQRLENWVNDGVFTAKRKKHLETTTVSMSRPALSKSFHVFHEPAPKLPSVSRSKKMLAHVERRKIKETVESRRRSSGEGLVDIKHITQKQEKELSAIKRRLKNYLEGELENEIDSISWMKKFKKELRSFADLVLQEEEPCLVALAQALVNYASVKFTSQRLTDIREIYRKQIHAKDLLEQLLLTEFTSLNRRIIAAHEIQRDKVSGSTQKLQKLLVFRETELQIILRLEIAWCFEPDEDAMEDVLMEIVRLLQIIAAYRTEPPIEYFVNTVLLPTYSQSSRFMRGLYKKMNIPLPAQLAMDGSPVAGSSRRDDDASMISSTSSANLCPEDSASQLHVHKHKRRRPSPSSNRVPVPHSHHLTKKVNSGSKKQKRHIMVATSNPKLSSSHFMMDRTDSQKKGGGGNNKASPKRVRRNLFDVQKSDKKDTKTLLTLANSSSRLTKSPAFKSPKAGKSPRSPSGFFRAARSRRQLVLSQPIAKQFGSPTMNSDVLCPESPATPGGALSGTSKYAATSTSTGSTEKHRVIQESPEILKTDFDNRPIGRVASLSFYSTGSNAPKSRAWEKSETQLMAARLKESVDIHSKELSLSDFETLPQSPNETAKPSHLSESTDTPRTNLSFCDDSYTERIASPLPSSSSQFIPHLTGPAPNLDNPNIQALITSNNTIFPLFTSIKDESPILAVIQTEPGGSPSAATHTVCSPSNLQTPSKRVQFNLNENLVNTPSTARRTSTGTPKSILKETHDT